MPRIDVLPTSAAAPTPGYALIPDLRGTSQNAGQPVAGRKRAARRSGFEGGDTTVRQQNAVLKHLAELDKDNSKDVHIPVHSKHKDAGAKASARKMTPNVRRILLSQKTFANHLADEEAALAQQTQNPASITTKQPLDVQSEEHSQPKPASSNDPLENDPLLRTYVPQAPSAEIMELLTNAPPLSYNASRAELSDDARPPRHFCEICGYWGTIKCMKCGARVCGLDCKNTHDDGRCLKFYA